MKRIILFFAALSISFSSYSQLFEIGPRVELTTSNLNLKEEFETLKSEGSILGFKAGLYTRISLLGFYVQPEVLFSQQGGEISVNDGSNAIDEVAKLQYNKIDVPVMIGKRFAKVFRFNFGPTFSYVLSDEVSNLNDLTDVAQNYNDAIIGYQVGIGLDISKLRLDVKYEGNLSKFGDSISIPGISDPFNTDYRNNMIIFGLAINLL